MRTDHVRGGHSGLGASAFLSHSSLSFLKSLKKKLTILQETLKLPPGDSETINRLVLERFVDPLGWNRDSKLEELPGKGVFTLSGFVGVRWPRSV